MMSSKSCGKVTLARGMSKVTEIIGDQGGVTTEDSLRSSGEEPRQDKGQEDGPDKVKAGGEQESHALRLSAFFRDLYKHAQLTDIKIRAGSYTFSAHKAVLACFSPFFANKVLHSNDGDYSEICLDKTITPTGFKKILDYIYSRELTIEVEDLAEIFQAANVLQIPELQERCLVLLQCAPPPALLEILEMAHKQDIRFVCEEIVLQRLSEHFQEVVKLDEFDELCADCLFLLMSRDDLIVQTEYQVAEGVIQWVRTNPDERLSVLTELFSCVRLENMNSDEILKLGQEAPFLLHDETVRENILRAHWYKRTVELGSNLNVDDIDLPKPRKYTGGGGDKVPTCPPTPAPTRFGKGAFEGSKCGKSGRSLSAYQTYYMSGGANKANSADMFGFKPRPGSMQDIYSGRSYTTPRRSPYQGDDSYLQVPQSRQQPPRQWAESAVPVAWDDPRQRPRDLLEVERQPITTSQSHPLSVRTREDVMDQRGYRSLDGIAVQDLTTEPVNVGRSEAAIPHYILRIKKGRRHHVDKFPMSEQRWVSCNMALPSDFHFACTALVGDHLLFIGGLLHGDPHGDVWALDVRTDKWRQLAPLNLRRYMHGTAVLGRVVYVVGGIDEFGNALSDMECLTFDGEEDQQQWKTQQPMPFGRYGACVSGEKDVIYVAGGMNQTPVTASQANGGILSSVACFYLKYRTWDSIDTLRFPRYRAALVAYDRKVYAIGGIVSLADRVESSRDIDVWDGRRWSKVARMARARYDCCACVHNDRLYVFGGHEQSSVDGADSSSTTNKEDDQIVEVFSIERRKWMDQIFLGPLAKDAKFAMIAGP